MCSSDLHPNGTPRPCQPHISEEKGEEREKGVENVFEEIMAENFPNLKKETNIQIQEAKRVPNKINPRRDMPKHIVIKLTKIK